MTDTPTTYVEELKTRITQLEADVIHAARTSMAIQREADEAKVLRDRLRRCDAECAAGQEELEKLRKEKAERESVPLPAGAARSFSGSYQQPSVLTALGIIHQQPLVPWSQSQWDELAAANKGLFDSLSACRGTIATLEAENDRLRETIVRIQDERASLRRKLERPGLLDRAASWLVRMGM